MKAWITKYALSTGIFAAEGHVTPSGSFDDGRAYGYFNGEGKNWHRTPEAAIRRAEEMRIAKIASLKKQIAKLENMTFEVKV